MIMIRPRVCASTLIEELLDSARERIAELERDLARETGYLDASQEEISRLAERIAELERERDDAHGYLSRLFTHQAPQCEPFAELKYLCTQIDNLIAGLVQERNALQAKLAERDPENLLSEIERRGSIAVEYLKRPGDDMGEEVECVTIPRDALREALGAK